MEFPNGAEFAFSILDDTDDATVSNASPFYRLLTDLGFRTTKTVWPFAVPLDRQGPYFAADTLDSPDYVEWIRALIEEGFEIASHNASMGSCTREETVRGLEILNHKLGVQPRLHCNHGQNRENLYWGRERFRSLPMRFLATVAKAALEAAPYEGHREGSPYFWGDIAKAKFKYVRSFAFSRLSLRSLSVPVLYTDASTPWVNSWFLTSDAPDATAFVRLLNPTSIETLRRSGQFAIVSTHVGKGFVDGRGEVIPEVRRALEVLARLKGWYAPVTTILDHVAASGVPQISAGERLRLEWQHVRDRIRTHGV